VKPAVFIDRDGVINVDGGYVSTPEDFHFIDGVFAACKHFSNCGYELFIVTNQSGIARGYYTEDDFHRLTGWMLEQFVSHGVRIRKVYFCPHHPDKGYAPYVGPCECRKPAPGMLLQAIREYDIDPAASIMLGDKAADMQAATAAGIGRRVLVLSGQTLGDEDRALADEIWPSIHDGIDQVRPLLRADYPDSRS